MFWDHRDKEGAKPVPDADEEALKIRLAVKRHADALIDQVIIARKELPLHGGRRRTAERLKIYAK